MKKLRIIYFIFYCFLSLPINCSKNNEKTIVIGSKEKQLILKWLLEKKLISSIYSTDHPYIKKIIDKKSYLVEKLDYDYKNIFELELAPDETKYEIVYCKITQCHYKILQLTSEILCQKNATTQPKCPNSNNAETVDPSSCDTEQSDKEKNLHDLAEKSGTTIPAVLSA